MASTVTFTATGGLNAKDSLAKALQVLPSEEAMLYAASRQIARIRLRTAQGLDVNGIPFQPYSPGYAKSRASRGRNVTPVDLLMSGRMLNSLVPEVRGPREFAITVMDAEAAIYGEAINDGEGHQPRRRFFDTSRAEQNEMAKDLFTFDAATRR